MVRVSTSYEFLGIDTAKMSRDREMKSKRISGFSSCFVSLFLFIPGAL